MQTFDITIYFVGATPGTALEGLAFDSEDSAGDYAQDNPGTKVYSVQAIVHPDTIEEVG